MKFSCRSFWIYLQISAELPAAAQEEEQGDMTTDEYQDEPGEFKHLKIKTENPEAKNGKYFFNLLEK